MALSRKMAESLRPRLHNKRAPDASKRTNADFEPVLFKMLAALEEAAAKLRNEPSPSSNIRLSANELIREIGKLIYAPLYAQWCGSTDVHFVTSPMWLRIYVSLGPSTGNFDRCAVYAISRVGDGKFWCLDERAARGIQTQQTDIDMSSRRAAMLFDKEEAGAPVTTDATFDGPAVSRSF